MTMHCSANVGKEGDSALFFGLSGTGKTTLSADPHRNLIGDDEHGWDEDGIFNFEGGCYAKTINLSEENEPDIYRAIRTDALLENCTMKEDGTPDYDDVSKTQNGRVSYPIFHIPNYHKPQVAGHPQNIIFLTCDAFGVLPPVAKLSSAQAMYHFIAGYTAKVAGTEVGVTEPEATFSACFGEAFLAFHPTHYAEMLAEKVEKFGCDVWLVNTGWAGGAYGVGERMSLKYTRKIIDGIHSGDLAKAETEVLPLFNVAVPTSCPGVPDEMMIPNKAWEDRASYDATLEKLAGMFAENFRSKYSDVSEDIKGGGPF